MLFIFYYNKSMNERIKLSKNQQINFLQTVKIKSQMDWATLGKFCGVTGRTLREWAKVKYTLPKKTAELLNRKFNVPLPKNFKILKPYWYIQKYARQGALARQRIYGLLGNIETRRKGGLVSQVRRKQYPEKYRALGCIVRKQIQALEVSNQLAELCGVLLGDGGITNWQVCVTLNRFDDAEYAAFVLKLMEKVFKIRPYQMIRKNVIVLILSGVALVEELEKFGLKRGNKVANQVTIPDWILTNKNYSKACLRGLMDTDGCVYHHNHVTKGIKYLHLGLNFSNHSRPLLFAVHRGLSKNGIKSSLVEGKGVYIYNLKEVKKYFKVIGSHNPKHINKFKNYLILKNK